MRSELVIAAVLLVPACSRKVEEKEPLIEHRVQPCTQWCEILVSEQCGRGPADSYDSVDACVQSCATADGNASWGWGHQKDGNDACSNEWTAMSECVVMLSCEQQSLYFSDEVHTLPENERPCWTAYDAMADCQIANPQETAK